MIFGKLIEI